MQAGFCSNSANIPHLKWRTGSMVIREERVSYLDFGVRPSDGRLLFIMMRYKKPGCPSPRKGENGATHFY